MLRLMEGNEWSGMKQNSTKTIIWIICLVILVAIFALIARNQATSSDTIQGIVWKWSNVTNQTTSEVVSLANPENYTIVFNEDGTLNGQADCNNFTGTYSQSNGFTITLGATTMAFCSEESLDQQYLTLLSSVVAGGPDGTGGLALETAGGEQRMLFNR
jgi:heat shock protein HslJ